MAVSSRPERDERANDSPARAARIGAYESRPGRLVFIEEGNTDAWIATDHTVDLRR